VRWLLVEAAWRLLRTKSVEAAALRAWAHRVAGRRGKKIAVVALARRLAGVLYAMWRDGMPYDASRIRVARLATAPAIGPVTASTVVATVDDITRFRCRHLCSRVPHGKLRAYVASRIRQPVGQAVGARPGTRP